ncbi:MAG: sugar transferase [Candidatus Magasanikbacteria bacterium]
MKRSEIILMVLQVPIDFLMLVLAGISAYYLRFTAWATALKPVVFSLTFSDFLSIVALVSLSWLIIFSIVGLYSTDPNRKLARDLVRVVLACSTGVAVVAVYILFVQQLFDSRFLVLASWCFAILYVGIGRILMRMVKGLLYRAGVGLRRVVIIGTEHITQSIVETLKGHKELGYAIAGVYPSYSSRLDKEFEQLKINEMIFTNPRANEKETIKAIDFCSQHHITFKYSADLFATYASNMSVSALAGVPIVEVKRTPLDGWGRVAKRIFDIVTSTIVLVFLSPFMFLISVVILLETGRPIIYKNERIGIRGRKFFTYKFRSMYQKDSTGSQFGEMGKKAEEKERELIQKNNVRTGPIYKIKDDPRVTPFGRFLRRWSIDELPQFLNVLKGSMSIVGPRPHQPREVDHYEKDYPHVFTLKPGITGLAQISGRSDLSFEEEMRLDILYTEKWSLLQDIIIFIKTPFVVFKKRRAL